MRFGHRSLPAWLLVALVCISAACSSPAPDTTSPRSAASAPPPQATRPGFEIGKVTPEQLSLSANHVAPQVLSVSYSIPNPETVSEARLQLYITEAGVIATQAITPQDKGVAQFIVEPSPHALGAVVRFRASCAQGVTDWHWLGQIPYDYDTRMSKDFRIASVMPESIRWTPAMESQDGAGQRVTIWGPALTSDCRIEAQVNGAPIELMNVRFTGRGFEGLLKHSDIGYSGVSPRYAELKLHINRGGHRTLAIKRIAFRES